MHLPTGLRRDMIVSLILLCAAVRQPSVKAAPSYAHFLGIVMGTNTTHDLESHIGKGHVQVGGHSNSGRHFKFRVCEFMTDAFTRHGDRFLIDLFQLAHWKNETSTCYPFSKYKHWPLGTLRYGELMTECAKVMKRQGLPMKPDPQYGLIRKDRMYVYYHGAKYVRTFTLELSGGTHLTEILILMDENPS